MAVADVRFGERTVTVAPHTSTGVGDEKVLPSPRVDIMDALTRAGLRPVAITTHYPLRNGWLRVDYRERLA